MSFVAVEGKSLVGRPSKFNENVKERLLYALSTGNAIEPSCVYAGIDYTTYRKWMQRGEKEGKGVFFEFYEAVNVMIAEAEINLIGKLNNSPDWKASAWILERRHSERWSASHKIKVEVEKQLEAAVDVLKGKLPPEIYEQVLQVWTDSENTDT